MITASPAPPEPSARATRSSPTNLAERALLPLCALLGIVLLGSLVAILWMGAGGFLGQTPPASNTTPELVTLLATTFSTSLIALGLAAPIGLLAALYLSEFADVRMRSLFERPLRFLAHVPPIVYGYFAVATFLPALARFVPDVNAHPSLGAGMALAGMLVPCFVEHGRTAIATVPQQLRDGAYALGASKFATAWFVVVPAARTRLFAALLLATSRAVGEAMIVLVVFRAYASRQTAVPTTLTTFFVPNDTTSLLWDKPHPPAFFIVGCALLLVAFGLDAGRVALDKSQRNEVR